MGRSSKFSFPIPGRKKNIPDSDPGIPRIEPRLSKAQRILGVERPLNIDAPVKDDEGIWHSVTRPCSSGMSIVISETTQDEEGNSSAWEEESSVLPRSDLHAKASSTILGRRFVDDESASESTLTRRLHHESSSSTLRSYYDRTKIPLAVSQQTSASSARDLALRKGTKPIVNGHRAPLLDAEHVRNDEHNRLNTSGETEYEKRQVMDFRSKKKSKLDLSRMWSRGKKESKVPTVGSRSPLRPREVGLVSQMDAQYNPDSERRQYQAKDSLRQLFEQYEDEWAEPIPELPTRTYTNDSKSVRSQRHPVHQRTRTSSQPSNFRPEYLDHQMSSEEYLKQMRAAITSPWDKQSTASSKRTAASALSESDLKKNSVLSLSSDEESDGGEDTSASSVSPRRRDSASKDSGYSKEADSISVRSGKLVERNQAHKGPPTVRLSHVQDGNYLTIPLPSPGKSRFSGPWIAQKAAIPSGENANLGVPHRPDSPDSIRSEAASTKSGRVMQVTKQEEALLSALRQKRAMMKDKIIQEHEEKTLKGPDSTAKTSIKSSSSRTQSSRSKAESMHSTNSATRVSAASTIRAEPENRHRSTSGASASTKSRRRAESGASSSSKARRHVESGEYRHAAKEEILMYLDQPICEANDGDLAEPSPDLSDFLSFGSDDENGSTPRTSWVVERGAPGRHGGKERARPDSILVVATPKLGESYEPYERELIDEDLWPQTPRSAVRLSAVGTSMSVAAKPKKSAGSTRKEVDIQEEENEGWETRFE